MQAPVLGRDQLGERAEVGVEQLRVLAPLLDHADDLVLAADRAQDAGVRRVAGLALAARGQLQLLEQDPRDLLGRAELELLACQLVGLRLELLDPIGETGRDLAHAVRVDPDSGALHRGEDGGQRELDLAVQGLLAPLAHALEERVAQPERRGRSPYERGRLLFGLRLRDELQAVLGSEVVELVLGAAGLDQVREDQRVVGRLDPERLGVVRDDLTLRLERLGPGRDDHLVPGGNADALVTRRDPHRTLA